jgi:hypothetical protein
MPSSPQWLDIVRHRVPGFRAPYLLVVQHHDIPATTLLVAPVSLSLAGEVDVLAPRLTVDGAGYRARLLDISAVPRRMIGDTVMAAVTESDNILDAIDVILHGYSIGRRPTAL